MVTFRSLYVPAHEGAVHLTVDVTVKHDKHSLGGGSSPDTAPELALDVPEGSQGASGRQFWGLLGAVLGPLGVSLEHLGGLLGRLGGLLGASGPLGASLGPLGASWGPLGAEGSIFQFADPLLGRSWARHGGLLGRLGRLWGPRGALLGRLGAVLGAS